MATVSQIIQDNKGFIWLAGQQGLSRFDGKALETFNSGNTDWPIPFNWLHDVAIDLDNEHLLLATETSGLWRFNPKTGKVNRVPTEIPRESHYNVISFQGDYYINAPDKLYRFQSKTSITSLIDSNIKIKKMVSNNNHLYIVSQSGLYQLKNDALIKILNEPISDATAIPTGIIAVTGKSITRINNDGSQISENKINNIEAITREFNSNNFFTVTTLGHINKFSGETLQPLTHNFGVIKPIRIRSFYHDSSGILWLVSNRGVEQVSEKRIGNYSKVFDIKINSNKVIVFNNEIIIGTYGAGLQNLSTDTLPLSVNDEFSRGGLRITSMTTVNNTLYVGTFDGVWKFNDKNSTAVRVNFPDNNKLILKLKHHNNMLYYGTNAHGMYVLDLASEKIIKNISSEQGLSSPEILDILPLNNGYTWLATSTTVDIVNNHTKNVHSLKLPGKSKVASLLKSGDKVFATSLGDGIYAFNLQGELLAHFGQGIRFNRMLEINKEIWVAARPGLYRFTPDSYQLSMIESTVDYTFVEMVTNNNVVYASHFSGVLSLDLTEKEKFNPKVHISKTTVSGVSYLLNKAIEIDSGNDVITLDLSSLDYRPGAEKKYQYTLNGNQWHQINGNQLTLTGLASGDYHIEIMATNSLGQWSSYKAFTNINVAYPWYWTPQIRLIYGVSLLGFILLSIWLLYLRSKSSSHVHDILQKDISNYGKTSIQVKRNLSAALTFLAENETKKCKLLLQQCVDDLNEQQKSPEPNVLNGNNLNEAIPFLAEYLGNKYQVKLSYQFEISEKELAYELQADLYRVIYEAITSAILSGNGRNFKVILQKFQSKLWLNISDDSQSFIHYNSKVNFNISMYYIRQIASKHNGTINTFNEQGNASQLVLSLPIMHGN
jgi:ligand-binding sensor domain-containing protein